LIELSSFAIGLWLLVGWEGMGRWQTDERIYGFMYEVMHRWMMDVYGWMSGCMDG